MNGRGTAVAGPVQSMNSPMDSGSYLDTLGLELKVWREGLAEVEVAIGSHLLNRSGFVHGGVILSMLDVACARAGCWSDDPARPKLANTLSMTTNFLRSCRDGTIRASARRLPGGTNIFTCQGEVHDAEGNLLAVGQAVFRHRNSSAPGQLQAATPLVEARDD